MRWKKQMILQTTVKVTAIPIMTATADIPPIKSKSTT